MDNEVATYVTLLQKRKIMKKEKKFYCTGFITEGSNIIQILYTIYKTFTNIMLFIWREGKWKGNGR